jgi:peroxiredoxin Q/BCP
MKMKLKPKDKARDFNLADQDGKKVSLSDFKGRKVLLFFYPKAGTSGWTTQAVSLRDAGKHLDQLKVSVVGISPDKPETQKKFAEKNHLCFPLLSDPDHKVAKTYGAWGQKTMYGKKVEGIIRSSFLIDDGGKIMAAWYKISPPATVPEALKVLEP